MSNFVTVISQVSGVQARNIFKNILIYLINCNIKMKYLASILLSYTNYKILDNYATK